MRLAPIILLILTACALGSKDKKERAHLYLKIGTAHLQKGNYPSALSDLLKSVELDPTNPVAQNNLGLSYFVRSEYDLAEKHVKKAIELEPSYTEARNNLGRIHIDQKKFKEAVTVLKFALKDLTYPTPNKLQSNLGLAYFKAKNWDKARSHFRQALKLSRSSCVTYNYYGRTLFELKEYQLAARSFDRAIVNCKKIVFDEPHYFSALSYRNIGNIEEAKARLNELVYKFPDGKYYSKAVNMLKGLKN